MPNTVALIMTLVSAVTLAGGNLLIRAGLDRAGGFAPDSLLGVPRAFLDLMLSPMFTIGFAIYFAGTLIWLRVIAIAPLTVAYPLLIGLTFLMVSIFASLLFQEPISLRKAIGLGVILCGIIIVSTEPAIIK